MLEMTNLDLFEKCLLYDELIGDSAYQNIIFNNDDLLNIDNR